MTNNAEEASRAAAETLRKAGVIIENFGKPGGAIDHKAINTLEKAKGILNGQVRDLESDAKQFPVQREAVMPLVERYREAEKVLEAALKNNDFNSLKAIQGTLAELAKFEQKSATIESLNAGGKVARAAREH